MNKVKLSQGKLSLVTVLSLGFIVLGIGLISLAIYSMGAQYEYYVDSIPSSYSITTNEESVNVETDPPAILRAPVKTLYTAYPAEGDNIGSLTIPALRRKLPIFQGTGVNELKKGVGHFTQSVLPGEEDNSVLSGHRDTTFRQLGNLKVGDQLVVQTLAGTFTYEITGTRIVHADDKTVIVPTDHAVLTLTTCYPFYFVGNAPDRYIVSADLVISLVN